VQDTWLRSNILSLLCALPWFGLP